MGGGVLQGIKELAAKPAELSLIPKTYKGLDETISIFSSGINSSEQELWFVLKEKLFLSGSLLVFHSITSFISLHLCGCFRGGQRTDYRSRLSGSPHPPCGSMGSNSGPQAAYLPVFLPF